MRVLLLNQAAHPDVVATAQHSWDLAQALRRAGHAVTVVASRSRYGSAGAAWAASEEIDGVRLERITASRFVRRGVVGRAVDAVWFMAAALCRVLTLPRHEVVVCLTTPPFIAVIGWLHRLLRGTPYVVWAMDLYPDVPMALGVVRSDGWLARVLLRVERTILRGAAQVVVLGRCMAARVAAKGVPASRVAAIHIWAHDEAHAGSPVVARELRARWAVHDRFLVMYAGNFGLVHDLDPVAEAVIRLADHPDITIAFVGGGPLKAQLLARLRASGVRNWVEDGYQSREELGGLLEAADLHLATLRAGFEGLAVPSKVLGAMAAGRPVLYMGAPDGEAARVIRECEGGATVANGDVEGMVRTITAMASDRTAARQAGERARQSVATRWSATRALEAWVALLESVAGGDAPQRDAGEAAEAAPAATSR